jgi:hypothetical protein
MMTSAAHHSLLAQAEDPLPRPSIPHRQHKRDGRWPTLVKLLLQEAATVLVASHLCNAPRQLL